MNNFDSELIQVVEQPKDITCNKCGNKCTVNGQLTDVGDGGILDVTFFRRSDVNPLTATSHKFSLCRICLNDLLITFKHQAV